MPFLFVVTVAASVFCICSQHLPMLCDAGRQKMFMDYIKSRDYRLNNNGRGDGICIATTVCLIICQYANACADCAK